MSVLDPSAWLPLEAAHQRSVDERVRGHLARARNQQAHPIEDFLFTYYSLSPGRLRRWHPGWRTTLAGEVAAERLAWRGYHQVADGVTADVDSFRERRGPALRGIRRLVAATAAREPVLGCFGLHEWAMVYRLQPGQRRHEQLPLRLGQADTDAVVAASTLRCTHFDAFRFFTEPATGLNTAQLTSADRDSFEQPGCLHAGMDVYKWAFQLLPLTSSALVLDAFDLAREIRVLDMRASPYDVTEFGYSAVPVETAAGRAEYARAQRGFSERAQELRRRLLAELPDDGPTQDRR